MEPNNLKPLPFGSKCVAKTDFAAEEKGDLPFSQGNKLTILGPCEVLFWYFARSDVTGDVGRIPVTDDFVSVVEIPEEESDDEDPHDYEDIMEKADVRQNAEPETPTVAYGSTAKLLKDCVSRGTKLSKGESVTIFEHVKRDNAYIAVTMPGEVVLLSTAAVVLDSRPPLPTPAEKKEVVLPQRRAIYKKFSTFMHKSGWYTYEGKTGESLLLHVLANKAHMRFQDIIKVKECLYTFAYIMPGKDAKRYIEQSSNLIAGVNSIFSTLYEASADALTPFQKQLLFVAPDSRRWSFSIEPIKAGESLSLELAKRIVERRTLQGGQGFNDMLEFTSTDWQKFKVWFAARHRSRKM